MPIRQVGLSGSSGGACAVAAAGRGLRLFSVLELMGSDPKNLRQLYGLAD
jgi:hypothetical protein